MPLPLTKRVVTTQVFNVLGQTYESYGMLRLLGHG